VRVLQGIEAPDVDVADNLQAGLQVSSALQGGHQADWVNPDAAKEYDCPICMKVRFCQMSRTLWCLSDRFVLSYLTDVGFLLEL